MLHDPIAVDEHPSALLNYPQRLGKTVRPVGLPGGICQHGKRGLELPRYESRRGLAPGANDESACTAGRYLIVEASQLDGMREALASSELPHEVEQDVAPAAKLRQADLSALVGFQAEIRSGDSRFDVVVFGSHVSLVRRNHLAATFDALGECWFKSHQPRVGRQLAPMIHLLGNPMMQPLKLGGPCAVELLDLLPQL